jgi:hypothetical protein
MPIEENNKINCPDINIEHKLVINPYEDPIIIVGNQSFKTLSSVSTLCIYNPTD